MENILFTSKLNKLRYEINFSRFALALLTQLDLKLATIIKKERMTYFSMGIEDPQSIFSMLLSPIKQALENPLGPVEFQATLKMALSLEVNLGIENRPLNLL